MEPSRQRFFPLFLAAIGGGAVALLLARGFGIREAVADPIPDILRARAFEVDDEAGTARARLQMDDKDTPSLTLLDTSGRERARLRLTTLGEPLLSLIDPNGQALVVLSVNSHGTPELRLGADHQPQASLSVYPPLGLGRPTPSLLLTDGAAHPLVALSVTAEGTASAQLTSVDAAGHLQRLLSLTPDGATTVP